MTADARLVLASASPRRLDLLRQIGLEPDAVCPAPLDEARRRDELPSDLARRLAGGKTALARERHADAYVLGADTVVAVGRRILPKPVDLAAARRCLELLSGRRHRVLTAIAVAPPGGEARLRTVQTTVGFKRLDGGEVDWYLASGEWRGKAGGYAIQGRAGRFVRSLRGSYSNVVGLPLFETANLLAGLGYPVNAMPGPDG